jgi:hypothetical protein
MNLRLARLSHRFLQERLWKLTWLTVLWKTSVTSMQAVRRLSRGLPQDLGKRFAFPTATLKTLRVSNSSHSLETSIDRFYRFDKKVLTSGDGFSILNPPRPSGRV